MVVGVNWLLWWQDCGIIRGIIRGVWASYCFSSSELLSVQEYELAGYADDSTLTAVVPFPSVRSATVTTAGLVRCEILGTKLNAMIESRARTMHPSRRINSWGVSFIPPFEVLLFQFCRTACSAVS